MKIKLMIALIIISILVIMLSGCAQPNEAEKVEVEPEEVEYLELTAVYDTDGYVLDIEVTDNYLYIAEDEGGFSIYDTQMDTLCSRVRGYMNGTLSYHFSNIKLLTVDEQSNALLAYNKYGSNAGVHVFDITDRGNPEWRLNHTGNSSGISDLQCSPVDSTSFQFYWINESTQYYTGKFIHIPQTVVWYISPETQEDFAFDVTKVDLSVDEATATGEIYCASKQLGMKVVSRSDFSILGTVGGIGQTLAVKVVDNVGYLCNREEGVMVVEMSDLDNPVELLNYDTVGLASEVTVNEELGVFALASTSGGIYLFRNNAGEIERLQRIDDSEIGYTYTVEIKGNELYVGTRYGVYKYIIVNV